MSKLPPGWTKVRFSEINSFTGRSVNPSTTPTEQFELYSVPSFPTGTPEFVFGSKIGSTKQTVEPDDVLVCKINPRINRVWQVMPRRLHRQIASSEWIVMRAAGLNASFLRHYFCSPDFRERICEGVTGVGGSLTRAQPKRVAEFPVPIAPRLEQKRIADKLDALLARVDACRERLDRVPAILKRFRQSILAAATTGELTREWREERGLEGDLQSFQLEDAVAIRDFSFPASWSARRLADIAMITGGVTKDAKKQSADFVELPYLRVANVQRGYLDLSEVKTIRVPPDRVADLLLRAGDILFNEGGDIDKLGRGWIWNDELPTCVFQNHVFRARLLDPAFEPRYFSWYGNSRGYEYFLARGKQTTNLASINKSVLSALPVAVPPADEQAEIVRRTSELLQFADGLERRCKNAAKQVVALTPSALGKAFRGELVPQDPNDQPASVMLAKLKTEQANAAAEPSRRRPKTPGKRPTMSNTDKDSIKAVILKLKTDRFSFGELRALVSGDYESLKAALFELLDEPNPVVRQVFDKKAKAMQLVRVKS
jgi:type I restriction enzyme S subunit